MARVSPPRVSPLDHMGIVHPRRHDEAAILVARAMVLAALIPYRNQHQVGILARRRVPFEELLRHLVVGELLVGDPMPLLAHIDHRIAGGGEGADQRGIAGNRLLQHHRAHPRIIHVPQLRAHATGDGDKVALVGLRRAATVDRHVEEVLADLDVVGEAAGAEDHGLAGVEAERRAVSGAGLDADDIAREVADDALYPMPGADIHAGLVGRTRHRFHRAQAAVRHRVPGVHRDQDAPRGRLVLGQLGPIVRHEVAMPIVERTLLLQELGRGRSVVVDRLEHRVLPCGHAEVRVRRVVALGAGKPRHVAQAVLAPVLHALVPHRLVVGHPVPEGGLPRRAADLRRLLQDQHAVAEPAGEERGRQATGACTDTDDVEGAVIGPARGGRAGGFALRDRRKLCHDLIPVELEWSGARQGRARDDPRGRSADARNKEGRQAESMRR